MKLNPIHVGKLYCLAKNNKHVTENALNLIVSLNVFDKICKITGHIIGYFAPMP